MVVVDRGIHATFSLVVDTCSKFWFTREDAPGSVWEGDAEADRRPNEARRSSGHGDDDGFLCV